MTEELEREIMIEEVEKAITYLRKNKAPRPDDVVGEFLEASNKELAQCMYEICPGV